MSIIMKRYPVMLNVVRMVPQNQSIRNQRNFVWWSLIIRSNMSAVHRCRLNMGASVKMPMFR